MNDAKSSKKTVFFDKNKYASTGNQKAREQFNSKINQIRKITYGLSGAHKRSETATGGYISKPHNGSTVYARESEMKKLMRVGRKGKRPVLWNDLETNTKV